jgi:hypothetical protein
LLLAVGVSVSFRRVVAYGGCGSVDGIPLLGSFIFSIMVYAKKGSIIVGDIFTVHNIRKFGAA